MNLEFLIKYAEAKKENKKIKILYYNNIIYIKQIKSSYNELYRCINGKIRKHFERSL